MSYLTLEPGAPVYARDGSKVGTVEHVLAAPDADIFDGLVIDTRLGPGGLRFADAPQVAQIGERGVMLALDAGEAERLPEPSPNPGTLRPGPDDLVESGLEHKLRRAWDWISGRY
ncbi:MAG: hypothetical protein QOD44_880 [Solirubrobacteraceae bacterium]|nr:hypothetical protein [Solirubrobacteraceae bacterium]